MDRNIWLATRSPLNEPGSEMNLHIPYVDVNRDEESWRPLLQETQARLEGKISNSATVKKRSAFFARILDLVPWLIHQAQLVKNARVRRIPENLMSNTPVTHLAAVLRFADGEIGMETQVTSFRTSRFETPSLLTFGVYGEAPATSMNPEDNSSTRTQKNRCLDQSFHPARQLINNINRWDCNPRRF